MEHNTPNTNPEELPESGSEGDIEPAQAPDLDLTEDEIESMSQYTDAALRAILGRC